MTTEIYIKINTQCLVDTPYQCPCQNTYTNDWSMLNCIPPGRLTDDAYVLIRDFLAS